MVWGAAWLYKATGEAAYLNKAKQYYNQFGLSSQTGVFSWDDKNVGVHALMAEITGESTYKSPLKSFCDHAVNGQQRSPKGMLFYYQWGSLRYASNAAFVCLQVIKRIQTFLNVYCHLSHHLKVYFYIFMPFSYLRNPLRFVLGC